MACWANHMLVLRLVVPIRTGKRSVAEKGVFVVGRPGILTRYNFDWIKSQVYNLQAFGSVLYYRLAL